MCGAFWTAKRAASNWTSARSRVLKRAARVSTCCCPGRNMLTSGSIKQRPRSHRNMSNLPPAVEELLEAALVGELTVVDATGHPVTYPLIPLYDGDKIYLTSSTLFSRKLEHIKGNPKVSLSITDPVAVG